MPRPTSRDLYIDKLLSDVSVAYMNEPSAYVADVVFPVITVPQQSGKVAIYNKGDWFRDEAGIRAPLSISKGGGFRIGTPATYFCDEWAYHSDIADEDIENAEQPFDLDDDATQYCVEKLRIRRERIFAENFFATGIWDNELQGQTDTPSTNEFKCWDESGSTPLTDIEDAKLLVKAATGLMPNTLLVSEKVHSVLKHHSDVLDRYKYTQTGIITAALLAQVFEVDRYVVGSALYAAEHSGHTNEDTLSYILNQSDALLVYSAPRPSKKRPSGGYTIRWNRQMNNGVEGERLETTIRKFELVEGKGGYRIEGSVYEDLKLIAAGCGVYFDDAIALGETIS